MRFSWTKGRGMIAVSAAIMALHGAPALAQFVPYTGTPNQTYTQYQAPPQYGQPQYRTAQAPQYSVAAFQQGSGARPAHAAQGSVARPVPPAPQGGGIHGSSTHAGPPVEHIAPGHIQGGAPVAQPVPAAAHHHAHPTPAAGYESYPAGNGYAGAGCYNYNTYENGGGYGGGYGSGGVFAGAGLGGGHLGDGLATHRGGNRWFGGVYGLFLERVGTTFRPLALSAPDPGAGFYLDPNATVINLQDLTETQHGGAEFRIGSTFGGSHCGCGPRFGWEAAYWGIIEEDEVRSFTDADITAGDRLYTGIDFRGLQYVVGANPARPLNEYLSFASPTLPDGAPIVRINSVTARHRFSAQNVELNLLRLPVFGGGCVGGSCDAGGCAGGSCGVGGYGHGGLGAGGFGVGGSRFAMTTLIGARYLRIDEDFSFDVDATFDPGGAGETNLPFGFDAEADNHLVGFQLGCNSVYYLGCSGRWALTANANAGIYGNRAETSRNLRVPVAGNLTYISDGTEFARINSQDDSIATVAEIRAGLKYQYSKHCRLFTGYRALGVSGIALAFDQIPEDFGSAASVQQFVDTSGSIFLHGLQSGVEFNY